MLGPVRLRLDRRWIQLVLSLCALSVGVACSDQSASAPSPVPPEPTAASAPAVTATTVEPAPSSVPYPQFDEDVEVRVRFIAYGDVDPNDDIDFGVIPDVRIAVITYRESSDWWNTVGSEISEEFPGAKLLIPPGAQMQSTAEAITASPIDFVTTGPDGTAETYLNPLKPSRSFSICVISPIDDLIAGCSLKEWIRPEAINEERIWSEALNEWRDPTIFYIYFSNGRAYIDQELDGSERYYRFLYGDRDSYSPLSEPATITLVATGQIGTDVPPITDHLAPGVSIAVINDADIGAWWTAVSDDGAAVNDLGQYALSVLSGWEFGWGIPYGSEARERVRQNTPVHYIDIDWPGILEVSMAPGSYLFCNVTYEYISHCDYESIVAAQDYVHRVNDVGIGTKMYKLTDSEAKQFLEEIKDWSVRSLYR